MIAVGTSMVVDAIQRPPPPPGARCMKPAADCAAKR
jgi:hypothetical protein